MTERAKPSGLESIKAASDYLRGSLPEEKDNEEPFFAKDTTQVLKFHGVYQQDDRDVRRERAKRGLGKDYICMVRASIPGGVLTSAQYLAMDDLASAVADETLRITTRQGLQYHFTRKRDLQSLIRTLNEHLVTTLAACGDVVRNVMCDPPPTAGPEADELQRYALELSQHVKPRSTAYWQLWIDGERAVTAEAPQDDEAEPLYGATYLPRKFKIGFAWPGDNSVDVYTHDVGLVPHLADGHVEAFTVLVGGGLGMSHNNPDTYPRLADPLCTIAPEELTEVVTAIIGIQRDHGDRSDRKHARMKYLVAEWGLERFAAELERRLGRTLVSPRSLTWADTDDHLGWGRQRDGKWTLGVRVENGRIADKEVQMRTALRRIVERFADGVRFTPRQDILLSGIRDADRAAVIAELHTHGVPVVEDLPPVARHAMACPALPTCGLAIAEAERVMPDLVTRLHDELEALGLEREAVHVRMTGCPNGCARPYSTEVGLVGRGKDHYSIHLGGDDVGTRLNTQYADRVGVADVAAVLRPVFAAWRDERVADESFGDYCDRVGVDVLHERFAPSPPPRRTRAAARA